VRSFDNSNFSNYHEQFVDILAVVYPDTRTVPREHRVKTLKGLFNTDQSAASALAVATKHIDDLQQALDERISKQRADSRTRWFRHSSE
jgi:superfamily II RNA helicase